MDLKKVLSEEEAKQDTLKPEEVVRLFRNPPARRDDPKFQEALQHVQRWEGLGMRLASSLKVEDPEEVVAERFPGIEETDLYHKMYPGSRVTGGIREPVASATSERDVPDRKYEAPPVALIVAGLISMAEQNIERVVRGGFSDVEEAKRNWIAGMEADLLVAGVTVSARRLEWLWSDPTNQDAITGAARAAHAGLLSRPGLKALAEEDSLPPEEVVRRLLNPPKDPREPAYQEALMVVQRWESKGMHLTAAGIINGPEDLLRARFPGIEKSRQYRAIYGSTEPSR